MDIGKLNWKKVVTSDGVTIGEVEGGELDSKSFQVTHVHVGLNDAALKEFGLKKPFLGQVFVCLPVDMVQAVNDAVTLKESIGELKNGPECREFGVR
jgi:sporulation protein YlmC with PRC-barrel domain